jgi:hypothetical protein
VMRSVIGDRGCTAVFDGIMRDHNAVSPQLLQLRLGLDKVVRLYRGC